MFGYLRKKVISFIFGDRKNASRNSGKRYRGRRNIDEYFGQFYSPRTLPELGKLLINNKQRIATERHVISFKELAFDSTIQQTFQKFGKPLYHVKNGHQIPGHEIIFYRHYLGSNRVIAQLHFLKNTFFMGQYLFRYLEIERFNKIKAILAHKYLADSLIVLDDVSICDANNNRIEIDNDSTYISSTIYYISGNTRYTEFIQQLETYKAQAKAEMEQVNIKAIYRNV